jgi:hypothetical protein
MARMHIYDIVFSLQEVISRQQISLTKQHNLCPHVTFGGLKFCSSLDSVQKKSSVHHVVIVLHNASLRTSKIIGSDSLGQETIWQQVSPQSQARMSMNYILGLAGSRNRHVGESSSTRSTLPLTPDAESIDPKQGTCNSPTGHHANGR